MSWPQLPKPKEELVNRRDISTLPEDQQRFIQRERKAEEAYIAAESVEQTIAEDFYA